MINQPGNSASDITVRRNVAVIGGGISGLVAAYKLASANRQLSVHIYEENDLFGGKVRTSPFAGKLVDEAADAFLARNPALVDLCKELGLASQLIPPTNLGPLLLSDNQLHALPSPSVMGVPTSLRSLFTSTALSKHGAARALLDLLPRTPKHNVDASVSTTTQSLGNEVTEKLIEPLIGGINAGRTNDLSALSTAPQIAALASGRNGLIRNARKAQKRASGDGPVFLAPGYGMSTLTNTLVSRLVELGVTLHARTTVNTLTRSIDGWALNTSSPTKVPPFDAVVFATPAFATASMLGDVDAHVAQQLNRIRYASVAMVRLAYKRKHVSHNLEASGYLSVPQQGRLFTAASFASSKWERLGIDDTTIFRLSAGRIDDDRATHMSDARLIAEATKELAFSVGASSAPIDADVIRWPNAFPQYDVGHSQLIRDIENDLARHPGLFLIGAATHGLGLASCAATATLGASQVLDHLGVKTHVDTASQAQKSVRSSRR